MAARNPDVVIDLGPLLEASKVITAAITISLDSVADLSLPELRGLSIVERRQPLTMSALAEGLGVNRSNASRACDRLVARGLVDRTEDPSDRRQVLLTLTPPGRRLLAEVMRRRAAVLAGVVGRMGPEDQRALERALLAFTAAADETGRAEETLSDAEGRVFRWLG